MRSIALVSLHYNRTPENISDKEIEMYLLGLLSGEKTSSQSKLKHIVYGLRFYYKNTGNSQRTAKLPIMKKEYSLPAVLNKKELKKLFLAPPDPKHRLILALIYSAGLRRQEFLNLKISDIDFERHTIHIRRSKCRRDRIVPLSKLLASGLKKYLKKEKPEDFLFSSSQKTASYSSGSLSRIMRKSSTMSGISKKVRLHTLRHSFATHLLEEGVSIITIRDLLGHTDITTTMKYLHVSHIRFTRARSPFDFLYEKRPQQLKKVLSYKIPCRKRKIKKQKSALK